MPVKPIIAPKYSECLLEDNSNTLFVYLNDVEIEKLQDIKATTSYCINNEIWLDINEIYLVLSDVSAKIIKDFINKKINIYFFKEDKSFIKGIKFS